MDAENRDRKELKILLMGDSAVEVEFGQKIDPEISRQVLKFRDKVEQSEITGITEIIPAYCTLTICYDPLRITYGQLCHALNKLYREEEPDAENQCAGRLVRIPVCYGGEYGPDLEAVADIHGLTAQEVIRIHTEPEYPVYMLGFIAGFPYLGGMDERLETPRLEIPRTAIAGGSVGIAGKQTGIYPVESPGGWRLIGRTPLKLYDPEREPVSLLRAGDRVKFVQISASEFELIRKGKD